MGQAARAEASDTRSSTDQAAPDRLALIGVPPARIDEVWDAVEPWIRLGTDRSNGALRPEDVRERVLDGSSQLWVVVEEPVVVLASGESAPADVLAVFVTHLSAYSSGRRVAEVYLLGGREMARWLHFALTAVEEWARSMGCHALYLRGRKGWERATGYEHIYSVFGRELGAGGESDGQG